MDITRRTFLAAGVAATATGRVRAGQLHADAHPAVRAISSANGLRTVDLAVRRIGEGADPVDAIVEGVGIVEADPDDMSVGLGGLPNEDGVVQLDSSVMHGPTHKAGAVAALENIMHPAQVALKVLRRTDHVLLVGEGALRFARAHGFEEQNLLTDKAREAWLRWRENRDANDDWLDADQRDWDDGHANAGGIPFTYGTIHCSAVDARGDLAGCTTTSGLSYKIPGRVGDSPLVGAGMYTDNAVGSAGATGRGEAVIQSCGAYLAVEVMRTGRDPTDACLDVLKRIAQNTKQKRLLDDHGRPNFNVTMYALRKDGVYGSASLWSGGRFAVGDASGPRLEDCAYLFERP